MKSLKVLPLVVLAAGLASGAVHAKGGNGGTGGGMGMGHAGMPYPGMAQRAETRAQSRNEKRVQQRDGAASDAQQYRNRDQVRTETREQSDGAAAGGR